MCRVVSFREVWLNITWLFSAEGVCKTAKKFYQELINVKLPVCRLPITASASRNCMFCWPKFWNLFPTRWNVTKDAVKRLFKPCQTKTEYKTLHFERCIIKSSADNRAGVACSFLLKKALDCFLIKSSKFFAELDKITKKHHNDIRHK